jgi:Deoxyribonuclease NucA/NucB
MDTVQLAHALPGEDIDALGKRIGLSQPPEIRCDKALASANSSGCVYSQKDAVFVVGLVSKAKEAEHIRDAQAAGLPGAYVTPEGTRGVPLQRLTEKVLQDANREVSCNRTYGIIALRPQYSAFCLTSNTTGCQCDEFPFASTYQGGTDNGSARFIQTADNQAAGGGVLSQTFYVRERVLDPIKSSTINGEDNFWVFIR